MQRGSYREVQMGRIVAYKFIWYGSPEGAVKLGLGKGEGGFSYPVRVIVEHKKGTSAHIKGFQKGGLSMYA